MGNDQQSSDPTRPPMAADRRRGPRFSAHLRGDETVEIWLDPSRPETASIVDESLDGVGLLLTRSVDVSVGRTIDVIYRGVRRRAQVRDFSPASEGTWRMGLLWRRCPL